MASILRNAIVSASALGLSVAAIAAAPAPAPLNSYELESTLKATDSGAVLLREKYTRQHKLLENTHRAALDLYEDLILIGDSECRELGGCEVPGPIKHRLPAVCFRLKGFGEYQDHGLVRDNVRLIENTFTDSLSEVIVIGPIEGDIKLRGGPPGEILELICGGRVDNGAQPDVNANVNAGPSCIEHGGSPEAKSLRISVDSDGVTRFVVAGSGCTDN